MATHFLYKYCRHLACCNLCERSFSSDCLEDEKPWPLVSGCVLVFFNKLKMHFIVQQWKKMFPKCGLTYIIAGTAPPMVRHHTQSPLSHATLDWRKCKSAPCFVHTDPVPFLKSHYPDVIMAQAWILSMFVLLPWLTYVKHTAINQEGRENQKFSVYCVVAVLPHLHLP